MGIDDAKMYTHCNTHRLAKTYKNMPKGKLYATIQRERTYYHGCFTVYASAVALAAVLVGTHPNPTQG